MSDTVNELDIKLKLLAGLPWKIDGVGTIYPPTLRDIIGIGYTRYLGYVSLMTLNPSDFIPDEELAKQVTGFDLLFVNDDREVVDSYEDAIRFFFREEDVKYSPAHMSVIIGELKPKKLRLINRSNYNQVKDIVSLIACLKNVEETSYNPSGEMARQIVEKIKKRKEIARRQKAQNNDGLEPDLFDLISSVSAKQGDIASVLDRTIYQFMDQYKRLERINDYDFTTTAMMHVGSKDLKIKHWAGKIVEED